MIILVVDDSKNNRLAAHEQLGELGHEVIALADYARAAEVARERKFDAALLDLLMPAETMTLGTEGLKYLGEPTAVGYPLAIKLALMGVPLIAVATDTNHHNHPASAIMDWFGYSFQGNNDIRINDSKVLMRHAPMTDEGVKNWAKVLEKLLAA